MDQNQSSIGLFSPVFESWLCNVTSPPLNVLNLLPSAIPIKPHCVRMSVRMRVHVCVCVSVHVCSLYAQPPNAIFSVCLNLHGKRLCNTKVTNTVNAYGVSLWSCARELHIYRLFPLLLRITEHSRIRYGSGAVTEDPTV